LLGQQSQRCCKLIPERKAPTRESSVSGNCRIRVFRRFSFNRLWKNDGPNKQKAAPPIASKRFPVMMSNNNGTMKVAVALIFIRMAVSRKMNMSDNFKLVLLKTLSR
jgi:hypothetical protein